MLELYLLGNSRYCGWVSFTVHLQDALKAVGLESEVRRIVERPGARTFSGVACRGVTMEEALDSKNPKLVIGSAKGWWEQTHPLLNVGAHLVIHSPLEVKQAEAFPEGRCIIIRRALKVPGATFIRHPYTPLNLSSVPRKRHAVSVARVARIKRPDIILEANASLPKKRQVAIYGFEDRLYGYYKLRKLFPEWTGVKEHVKSGAEAVELMNTAKFSVDLTDFGLVGADGGGTQYTFLESWDAGAALIVNTAWTAGFDDDMEPGVNCIAVANAKELKAVLKGEPNPDIVAAGRRQLAQHAPERIGAEYVAALKL